MKICAICKLPYTGYDHTAGPVAQGFCCDVCHTTEVLPARLESIGQLWFGPEPLHETYKLKPYEHARTKKI